MIIEDNRLKENYKKALNTIYNIFGEKEIKNKMKPIIKVGISPRAVSRYGICKYKNNGCIIEVSKILFELEDKFMIETLIHEILHTLKDTKGHNYKWKLYADKINRNTDYNIVRTTDYGNKVNYKVNIKCIKCGKIYSQNRINKNKLTNIKNKKCRCSLCGGNTFEILSK